MSKKARSEGNRVASAIKTGNGWYVSDVDLEDSGEDVFTCCETVKKTLGKFNAGFMLISAGVKNLCVVVSIHDSLANKVDGKEWLSESLKGIISDDKLDIKEEKGMLGIVAELDTPFKLKDVVRSAAFAYLRSKSLIQEESEDEEFYEF